jgi:hypothetical protein
MRATVLTSSLVVIRRCVGRTTCALVLLLPFVSASGQKPDDSLSRSDCAGISAAKCPAVIVSMVRLLATPENFNGRRVQVVGFVHLEFEDYAVYLHREDFVQMNYMNSLFLAFRPGVVKKGVKVNDRYDLIDGTFVWRESYPGGYLRDVVSIEPYHSRAEFRRSFLELTAPKP